MQLTLPAVLVCILLVPLPATAVTMDTVLIGNAGNATDPSDGDSFTAGIQHYGAVSYAYRIGTTEVTNAQYVEFLNAKAKSDPLGLYNVFMTSVGRAGIIRSGASGSYTYSAKPNMGDKPVVQVTWYNAIRFANWLNNGQGDGDTETGAYTLAAEPPGSGLNITRNPNASWFLPSEDEWYKAAYYQPAVLGGDLDNYWLYPTASNIAPAKATANSVGDINNPGANVANYAINADWNAQDGNVTTVGSAGVSSASFYGTFDQGGNVYEWNEAVVNNNLRGIRGGSWFGQSNTMLSSRREGYTPADFVEGIGFRVATIVPEPSTLITAAFGALGLFITARRQH